MRNTIPIAVGLAFLAGCSASSKGATTDGGADSGGPADSGAAAVDSTAPTDSGSATDATVPDDTNSPASDSGMMMTTSTDTGIVTLADSEPPTDTGSTTPDGSASTGFRAIALPGNNERITGAYCSDAHTCVVTGDPFGDSGHIYSTDGKTITGTLVTGDEMYGEMFNVLGGISFLGVSLVGGNVVARVIDAENAYVSAPPTTFTAATGWVGVEGVSNTDDFGLNTQFGFGTDGTHWTLVSAGRIWEATSAPSPTTVWTNIYSPQATSPIPPDIDSQRMADPTLCDTDPSVSVTPDLTQAVYIAADDSLIITPAGSVNQAGDDSPGVCISLDRGHTFHHSAFVGVPDGEGPMGIDCTSKDHCVAVGGLPSQAGSAYVYVTTNASMGATSTWTAATTPTLPEDTQLRAVAFAPDGMTGWLVGSTAANGSLMFTTTNGGSTWTDATSTISGLTGDNPLHSVYVLDDAHVWIGGENDTLITMGD